MVLCFYNGIYQTLDIHLYGNVYLMHVQLEMIHNILDMDNIYV